ncbi:helix-turn-helix domain-containing protein [Streptomyces gilvosporeus]|uniref:Uncharacterized protein n=1 Tax=Streptomyces gilvosporeus TaxID=553510 RepID=A0A1V0TZY1_9ACTN|nr:PucR family transcriptional regulator [Streptomyces gilvosporeus]ARF58360.1 hypothetical protein B1H19_32985 [Streptomyces gilvosporeus]
MTIPTQPSEATAQPGPTMPRKYAAIMYPELPSLFQEIAAELKRAIPEYAKLVDGPYWEVLQKGVEMSVTTFVDRVASPGSPTTQRDELCRRFGRFEAYEGRSLDNLQAAYRIGARLALRRARKVGRRYNVSPAVLLTFADSLLAYVEELVEVSRVGYLEAKSELSEEPDDRRRLLLRLLLADPSAPRAKIAELARSTDWPLPETVTVLALHTGARLSRPALDGDVLIDLADVQHHLLVPGPLDDDRIASLSGAFMDLGGAVGPTVPLADAAESLRWARRALELAEAGVIGQAPLVRSEEHWITLWLLSESTLVDHLAQRQLAPLAGLTPTQRDRLVETLRAWFTARGNAVDMAELLHVHPQTVRYRKRILERAFGDQLGDADRRFATEVVLRALDLRRRAALPPNPPRERPQEG